MSRSSDGKLFHTNHGQEATGQQTTENANPGQKSTRKKDHPDKRPPRWFFSLEKS